MITGMIVLDVDDRVVILPNDVMVHPVMGHISLIRDLVEGGVLVISPRADHILSIIFPDLTENLGSTSTILVGGNLPEIIEEHPLQNIMVLGSDMVKSNLHLFDTILIFKYKSSAVTSIPCPAGLTKNLKHVNKLIYFDMLTYKED